MTLDASASHSSTVTQRSHSGVTRVAGSAWRNKRQLRSARIKP